MDFPTLLVLFQAAAEAERIHAEGHLKALEGVSSTAENLQAALPGPRNIRIHRNVSTHVQPGPGR